MKTSDKDIVEQFNQTELKSIEDFLSRNQDPNPLILTTDRCTTDRTTVVPCKSMEKAMKEMERSDLRNSLNRSYYVASTRQISSNELIHPSMHILQNN